MSKLHLKLSGKYCGFGLYLDSLDRLKKNLSQKCSSKIKATVEQGNNQRTETSELVEIAETNVKVNKSIQLTFLKY